MADDQSVDHAVRMPLREDLWRIEQAFQEDRWPGTRSVAVCACGGRHRFEEIRLSQPVRERVVVDETAFVRPVGLDECLWAGSVAAIDRLLVQSDAIVPGVLDELVQTVIEEGGAIRHTRLREDLVAAELRFPLSPVPTG